jgi:group I intron endonuclease
MGYVGQTVNTLSGRWKGHVRSAFNPNSRIGHWEFPKAIREHGIDAFIGRVLCECDTPEELSAMEDHWMQELNTLWPHGYNMRDGTNFICEQTRQRISQRTREAMAKCDPSWKDRQREAMKDPETRRQISERTKAAWQRSEVIARQAAVRDETWRARISETLKGHEVSDETRRKISENTKAVMQDPEVSNLLSERVSRAMQRPEVKAKMKNRRVSDEVRKKISASLRAKPKLARPIGACQHCGREFTLKRRLQRFCSISCGKKRSC